MTIGILGMGGPGSAVPVTIGTLSTDLYNAVFDANNNRVIFLTISAICLNSFGPMTVTVAWTDSVSGDAFSVVVISLNPAGANGYASWSGVLSVKANTNLHVSAQAGTNGNNSVSAWANICIPDE